MDKDFLNTQKAATRRQEIVVRDYFAGHALAALVAAHGANAATYANEIAKDAYDIADALIEEKRKRK